MDKETEIKTIRGGKQSDDQGISPLLTVDDLAQFFQVRPSTIRRWARNNKIPQAIKCGNVWRFHRTVLEMRFPFDVE